jgi:hypothetical protein
MTSVVWVQCKAMYPSYYYNKSMILVIMEKTILLIAAVVLGLCALEAVDLYFTMLLYSGQLP